MNGTLLQMPHPIGPAFLLILLRHHQSRMIHPPNFDVREAYQSLVGSIGWLAGATRPNIAPVHSFLLSYCSKPATGHMCAAIYALHYIHSTHDYRITFISSITSPIHTYVHFPDSSDVEAYTDAIPPS
jgi:hypothetical protein